MGFFPDLLLVVGGRDEDRENVDTVEFLPLHPNTALPQSVRSRGTFPKKVNGAVCTTLGE